MARGYTLTGRQAMGLDHLLRGDSVPQGSPNDIGASSGPNSPYGTRPIVKFGGSIRRPFHLTKSVDKNGREVYKISFAYLTHGMRLYKGNDATVLVSDVTGETLDNNKSTVLWARIISLTGVDSPGTLGSFIWIPFIGVDPPDIVGDPYVYPLPLYLLAATTKEEEDEGEDEGGEGGEGDDGGDATEVEVDKVTVACDLRFTWMGRYV